MSHTEHNKLIGDGRGIYSGYIAIAERMKEQNGTHWADQEYQVDQQGNGRTALSNKPETYGS